METKLSIDRRVKRIDVPSPRALVVIEDLATYTFPEAGFQGAIVWARPDGFDEAMLDQFKSNAIFACASAVRILPRAAADAPLPADAGADIAPLSDVSEVRPVVAELVSELAEELRLPATSFIESLLTSVGL